MLDPSIAAPSYDPARTGMDNSYSQPWLVNPHAKWYKTILFYTCQSWIKILRDISEAGKSKEIMTKLRKNGRNKERERRETEKMSDRERERENNKLIKEILIRIKKRDKIDKYWKKESDREIKV